MRQGLRRIYIYICDFAAAMRHGCAPATFHRAGFVDGFSYLSLTSPYCFLMLPYYLITLFYNCSSAFAYHLLAAGGSTTVARANPTLAVTGIQAIYYTKAGGEARHSKTFHRVDCPCAAWAPGYFIHSYNCCMLFFLFPCLFLQHPSLFWVFCSFAFAIPLLCLTASVLFVKYISLRIPCFSCYPLTCLLFPYCLFYFLPPLYYFLAFPY